MTDESEVAPASNAIRAANRLCIVIGAGFATVAFYLAPLASKTAAYAMLPVVVAAVVLYYGHQNDRRLGETRPLNEGEEDAPA